MIVLFFVGILAPFILWYWWWTREQGLQAVRAIAKGLVEAYKLEYPDRDIRELRFNIRFKDEEEEP